MRVCAVNGMKVAASSAMSRLRMPYFSLASTTIERPSGRFVGQRGELRRIRQFLFGDAAHRAKGRRLAVAERDGAGLVEQQRIDVAGGFDRAAGHRQHVEAHQPVHAGDADRRQQRADRGRDQRHEQRHQHHHRDRAAGIGRIARDRHGGEHEDDGKAREQDVERDLVRRLLPFGALHQLDHAVDEGRALRRGDADADPVRQHLSAAGHRRAVAAGFADHGRGFAGDRGLVDGGDAFDHFTIDWGCCHRPRPARYRRPSARCRAPDERSCPSRSAAWPGSRCGSSSATRPAPCRGLRRRLRRN